MKRFLILFFALISIGALAQKRTVDTLEFVKGGVVFQFIVYNTGEAVDSIQVNGYMVRLAGVASHWQDDGASFIKPSPDTKVIKYPAIPYWNHNMSLNTDGPVWYRKSDNTLRGHIMVPETIGGTETATITCEDGGVYIYETEGSDFVAYIGPIDSIPVPFMVKNLGKNSTVTVQSIEGLYFDSTATTSLTLDYGDWVRFTPDSTRFITESNMNRATLEEYYKKIEADTVFPSALIRFYYF